MLRKLIQYRPLKQIKTIGVGYCEVNNPSVNYRNNKHLQIKRRNEVTKV